MKENAPTRISDSRRVSQIPVKDPKRETLFSQTVVPKRQSLAQGNTLGQRKQPVGTTPTSAPKRRSTHIAVQTPTTTKRITNIKTQSQLGISNRSSNGHSIAQPRLMGTVQPSTPALADSVIKPTLSRASTEKGLQKKSSRASSRLSGISSSSLAGTKNEVRIPRSSTFHYIPRYPETPPPLPPVPEHFATSQRRGGVHAAGDWLGNSCIRSPLARFSQPRFKQPTLTESGIEKNDRGRRSSTFVTDPESNDDESSDDDLLTALPSLPPKPANRSKPSRPFSVNRQTGSSTNANALLQVEDYMPPLWWAGRFQTRFDQWRHEAMKAELDPRYSPEGILGHYKMSQEKIAACYIFLQLRDLCTTNKAADSLWVYMPAHCITHSC
jgi:hypothetical protein